VEEGGAERLGVEAHAGADLGDAERVGDEVLAGAATLVRVAVEGEGEGALDGGAVDRLGGGGRVLLDDGEEVVEEGVALPGGRRLSGGLGGGLRLGGGAVGFSCFRSAGLRTARLRRLRLY
jgi:hypothetical protein